MSILKRSGLFFLIVVFSYSHLAFSAQQLELEPIVITKDNASHYSSYSFDFAKSESPPSASFIESLSILPLDLQSRNLKNGIQTDFSLRGSTFQGVLMLIDGKRINDPQTAHHNSDIPLTSEDIERIEVMPGTSQSAFGPDAIGGAINFILKKPAEKKRVLVLSSGSHKAYSGLFSISEKIENLRVRLSLERQESEGFRYDTDFKKFNSHLASSLDIPCGEFDFNLGYQEKEFGAYDFYTPGLGFPSKEWTKTYLLDAGFNLEKEGFIIKPNFLWRRHYDKFMLDKTQVRSSYLNHHRTDVFTPNIYFQKETGALGEIGFGFEYSQERIRSTNLGNHSRNRNSIFADENKKLTPRLSLAFSSRLDSFDTFGESFSGGANLRFSLSDDNSLFAGVAKSMRIPSFTEIYYSDPTTEGARALKEENALSYQSGYDYKKEELSYGVTLFLREEEDFIDWVKRDPAQVKWRAENITEAQVKGVEGYLSFSITKNLTLDSNYTYIDKRINDKGYIYKYGADYSRHLVNSALSINLPFGVQAISASYKKRPARDGWVLLSAKLSYNLGKKSKLFVEIGNMANVEYQEIEGIPQPGRWIESGLRFEW
jgi:vitamin B12 transporter